MKNIRTLQNIVIDKEKVTDLIGNLTIEDLKQLFGVQQSQAFNLKRGEKLPSRDGILRLMMFYGLKPQDIAIESNKS